MDLTPVEKYAINMVRDGAESVVEDDMDEDGVLSAEEHVLAVRLVYDITGWIQENADLLLKLVRHV